MSSKVYSTRAKNPPKKNWRPYYLVVAAIVILAAIAGVTLLVNHYKSSNDSKQISLSSNSKENTGKQTNANLPATNSTNQSNTSTSSGTGGSAKGPDSPTTPSGAAPKAPSGQFVSSHSAATGSANGFAVNTENSVCNTSVGATCEITFTQNGVTKSLGKKTTDSSGAAYWSDWKVADYLTSGTWKITATATLNGQTTSTADINNLVVN